MDDYCEDCATNRCDCYPDECPVKYPAPGPASVYPAEPCESRLVELGPRKVLLVPPAEAAKYDPPLSEWFALPEYRGDGCPECGGERWGTVNPIGYLPVRKCHSGCSARWRTPIGILDGIVERHYEVCAKHDAEFFPRGAGWIRSDLSQRIKSKLVPS